MFYFYYIGTEIEKHVLKLTLEDLNSEDKFNSEYMQVSTIMDAADMFHVCRLIKREQIDEARKQWARMDTLPREEFGAAIEDSVGQTFLEWFDNR